MNDIKNIKIVQAKVDELVATRNKMVLMDLKEENISNISQNEIDELDLKIKVLKNKINAASLTKRNTKSDMIPKEMKLFNKENERNEKAKVKFESMYDVEKRIFDSDEEADISLNNKENLEDYNSNFVKKEDFETDSSEDLDQLQNRSNKAFTYEILKEIINDFSKSNETKGNKRIYTLYSFLLN